MSQASESRAVKLLHCDVDHPPRKLRGKVDLLGQIAAAIRQRVQRRPRRIQPGIVARRLGPCLGLLRRFLAEGLDIRRQGRLRAGEFVPRLGQRVAFALRLGEGLHQVGELAERFFESCQRLVAPVRPAPRLRAR